MEQEANSLSYLTEFMGLFTLVPGFEEMDRRTGFDLSQHFFTRPPRKEEEASWQEGA